MMKVCKNCKFWSDMIASFNGESLTAMCLLEGGDYFQNMTREMHGCRHFEEGKPIDKVKEKEIEEK